MAHKRIQSKTQKCCPCETETQPHSDNIAVITREDQACRCTPCYICVNTDFYGTICDHTETVPFTKSTEFSTPSGYFATVTCGDVVIDLRIRMETDQYGVCALYLSSDALGYVLTEYDDTRLRHLFGSYDDACRLITAEEIVFNVDHYSLGAGEVTVRRARFRDNPMNIATCGPTSDPYRCLCSRALVTRRVLDEYDGYGAPSVETVSACLSALPYPSDLDAWQPDFFGDNDVTIWIESYEPLVFGLSAPHYNPEGLDPPASALRTVRCVTPYDEFANMQAEWEVTQGPQAYRISIRADDHFHKYKCCKCWTDCLCISVSHPNGCIGRGVFCMDEPYPDTEQRLWTYSIDCEGGYPITGTVKLFCKCENTRPHLSFDGDDENAIEVECPLLTIPDFPNESIFYSREDGTTITVRALPCSSQCTSVDWPCCPGTAFKDVVYLTLLSMNPLCNCLHEAVVEMKLVAEINGRVYYKGIWDMPCIVSLAEPTIVRTYTFEADCSAGGSIPFGVITIRYTHSPNGQGMGSDGPFIYYAVEDYTDECEPLYIRYVAEGGSGSAVWVRCDDSTMDPVDVEMELTA